jgi:hypothetical protein
MKKQDLKTYLIDFQIKHLGLGINAAEANALTYLGIEKEQIDSKIAESNSVTIKAIKELIDIYCYENKITQTYFFNKRHEPLIKTKQPLIYFASSCLTLKEVGKIFKKHHSSIIHNRNLVEEIIKNPMYDIDLYKEYLRIKEYINKAKNAA